MSWRSAKTVPLPLAFLLLTLAILVPALVNGGGFVFSDTTAYVRGADAAVVKATGQRSAWSDRLFDRYPQAARPVRAPTPAAAASPAPQQPEEAPVVLSGRSIYYGALLYASLRAGGLWPIAILQAALTAAALLLTAGRFAASAEVRGGVAGVAALLATALLTPVGYYAAFAMPDIFAPLAILAGGNIAFAWCRMGRAERLFWLALLTCGMAFHTATLLIMVGLAILSLIVRAMVPALRRDGRSWPFLVAVALTIAAELLFSIAIRHATGFPPVRPPFLTARLIEDGPGLRYLRAHCGEDPRRFAICAQVDRLPLASDGFLWSTDWREGLFKLLPPPDQRLLAAQETRFAGTVLAADPLGVAATAGRNSLIQGLAVGLPDFNPTPDALATLREAIPAPLRDRLEQTAAFHDRMPVQPAAMLGLPLAIASLLVIGGTFAWRSGRRDGDADHQRLAFAGWIVAGVVLNAIVCGTLSGPHDRYGARVIWLLPVAALIVLGARLAPRASRPEVARGRATSLVD